MAGAPYLAAFEMSGSDPDCAQRQSRWIDSISPHVITGLIRSKDSQREEVWTLSFAFGAHSTLREPLVHPRRFWRLAGPREHRTERILGIETSKQVAKPVSWSRLHCAATDLRVQATSEAYIDVLHASYQTGLCHGSIIGFG